MKKKLFCIYYFLWVFILTANELYMAPLVILSDAYDQELTQTEKAFGDSLYDAILETDPNHYLELKLISDLELLNANEVRSTLDAGELCEVYNLDYLVYGFYRKSYQYIEVELRLFDRDKEKNRKIFYAKAESDELEMIRNDVADRFVTYMYGILGLKPELDEKQLLQVPEGANLSFSLGYWTPTDNWFEIYTGVVKTDLGIMIQPDSILFKARHWLLHYRFGLSLEYMLGLSKPAFEESYMHAVIIGLPVQLAFLIELKHLLHLGISVYYTHDFIYRIQIYGDPLWGNSGTMGSSFSMGYEYWGGESKRHAFGSELKCMVDFYKEPSLEIGLNFNYKYRIPFSGKKSEGSE